MKSKANMTLINKYEEVKKQHPILNNIQPTDRPSRKELTKKDIGRNKEKLSQKFLLTEI